MPGVSVYIKGLGKVNFPEGMTDDAIAEAVRRGINSGSLESAAGLPMDPASRIPRLKSWGVPAATLSAVMAEDAEAAVVGPVLARATDVVNTLRRGGTMPGEGGQTFLKPKSEATARVYDQLREQHQRYDTPVFDASTVPSESAAGTVGSTRYTMPGEYAQQLNRLGVATPDLIELRPGSDSSRLFTERITEAKEASPFGASVYVYDTPEYDNMRLFLTEDGSAGYALKEDGDIVSAFSAGTHKGVAPHLILHGIEAGGKKLDAFDTVLPDLYSQMGFREGGRVRWDDSQAPPDWNKETFAAFNQGEPDVSLMGYDRRPATPVEPRYFDDYGDAMAAQEGAINLKTLIPAAVAMGIAATPEEAEAKGLSGLKRELVNKLGTNERLMELGYLDPANIERPDQVKRAFTRYLKNAENNPAFLKREILHDESPLTLKSRGTLPEQQYIDPENLVGRTGVPVVGDRSLTGQNIVAPGVTETRVEGGARYGQEHLAEGDAWASMRDAAEKKQRNFDLAAEQTGQDVVGVYSAMGPEAISFSTPPAEKMVKMTQASKIPRAAKRAMDTKMRTPTVVGKKLWPGAGNDPKHPDKAQRGWVGIDHPDAMDQLMGRNGYPNIGNRRTWFTNVFGSKEADALGFPALSDVVRVATEPELADVDVGTAGYAVFDAVPGAETHGLSRHQSYDTAIRGQYRGGLEQQLPPEVMWPQTWADLSVIRNKAGKLYPRQQKTGSFMTTPALYEQFDEQWLEGVQHYMRTGELPPAREGDPNAIARQKAAYQAMKGEIDPRLLAAIGTGSAFAAGIPAGIAGAPRRLAAAGKIAEVTGRGFAGMTLGGLKALHSLATGQGIDKAVADIQGMNEWAMEGFEPRAQEVQDMEALMTGLGDQFRNVVGDQAVDLYLDGFQRAADTAYETLEDLDMPQTGAVVGAGIRGLEAVVF